MPQTWKEMCKAESPMAPAGQPIQPLPVLDRLRELEQSQEIVGKALANFEERLLRIEKILGL